MMRGSKWILVFVCGGSLLIAATMARAALVGTPHDFSTGTTFPHLSGKMCNACHIRSSKMIADFGNDFPDGVPVVAEPGYRATPDLPQAMRCLGCHDGIIRTPTGTDTIAALPTQSTANLNWSAGGSHNIWGMGQSEAYHPVQSHYPPEPNEQVWDPWGDVAADGNRAKGPDGRWYVVDPSITSRGLPLVTDPANPEKAYISCITCHDPHGGGSGFVGITRLDWPYLCYMCHLR